MADAKFYKLNNLELAIGYAFEDLSLLELALTHRSFAAIHNERLEYLGDSILGMIIAKKLYDIFPNNPEGDLTRMRSSLVRETTLAQIAREFHLNEYLKLGQGELKTGGSQRDSILADAVESIIAAVFIDSKENYVIVKNVVLKWFESRLKDINPKVNQKDPKSMLQELLQAHKKQLPVYKVDKITGSDNNQIFYVSVTLNDYEKSFKGKGASRRKAEQKAALVAWDYLNSIKTTII